MHKNICTILAEISEVLEISNYDDVENFTSKITSANRIVVYGAGRVGLIIKTFAMRLNHLNLKCNFLGEVSLPKTSTGDLLIIGSGSGTTKSVVSIAEIASSQGLDIISITSNIESRIAELSSSLIHLKCETKYSKFDKRRSIQPMTTLFEQSLLIFIDGLVLKLMADLNEDHNSMLRRHNVIE